MTIDYRPIIAVEEYEAVADLHKIVWSSDDRDVIPSHVLIAIHHVGGIVLGAFDGKRLVGFVVSFIGKRDGRLLHWSHEAGIHPDYQGRGIGSRLKWLQRDIVLEAGMDCIAWTFDPLQAGNARFNIHYLGCTSNQYMLNVYGDMQDELNQGLPSDRLEATWGLREPAVVNRSLAIPAIPTIIDSHITVAHPVAASPLQVDWPDSAITRTAIAIPENIKVLRRENPDLALHWRLITRDAFQRLFSEGFRVSSYGLSEGRPCYILDRTPT